jgi:hypothetical protein
MARPERPLDPKRDPVSQFAHALRELRHRAGSPTYRDMQAISYISYSSLARAAAGRRFPTWATTNAFVAACGDDPAKWKPRWEEAARRIEEEAARQAGRKAARQPSEEISAPQDDLSVQKTLRNHQAVPSQAARLRSNQPADINQKAPATLPSPDEIRTVAQLRTAAAEMGRQRDVRLISSIMRVQMSVVRLVRGWPEQVELPVFLSFVQACGVSSTETEQWVHAWQAAVDERCHQVKEFPSPGPIDTPEGMREVIETMVRLTSIKAVATRMETTDEGTVGRILRGAEHVEAELFARFVAACGAPAEDIDGWIEARRRVIETCERRRLIAVTAPALIVSTPDPQHEYPPRSDLPKAPLLQIDLASINTYAALLTTVNALIDAAGMSCSDIERISAGRLAKSTVTAIRDGVVPASGEEFVLLLRACGLREQIDQWVTAWSRVHGARLGNPPASSRRAVSPARSALRRITARTRLFLRSRWDPRRGLTDSDTTGSWPCSTDWRGGRGRQISRSTGAVPRVGRGLPVFGAVGGCRADGLAD